MKVLLINPESSQINMRKKATTIPLGLMAIASYLKREGYDIKVVDLDLNPQSIVKILKEFNPDVVGVTVLSTLSGNAAIKISKIAKKHNKPVVWGGFVPTFLTDLCLKEDCVDFVIIGEGELTFSELLEAIKDGKPYSEIDGLAYVENEVIYVNKEREFSDLADFPAMDWSLLNPSEYGQVFFQAERMIYLYSSKGCPAKCSFCYNAKYYGSKQRVRPIEQVVDEIEQVVRKFNIDGIYFSDEFWYPGKNEIQKFFKLIKEKELKFFWGCQTRLGVLTKEELQQMYDSGCRWILFGIESGCEKRIKEIKKGIDLSKAKETFATCRKIGIATQASFIIGYPGETVEELKKTINFARQLDADYFPINILYFQPGSEYYDDSVASGEYTPPDSLKEWSTLQTDEYYGPNFSEVPKKDLMVLHFYTQWQAFFKKTPGKSKSSNPIAKKTVLDLLDNLFRFGLKSILIGPLVAAKQFLTVFWYAKAHPKILKKYGLEKGW
ncbi:MAG: B12-binding domain-containing radical SAM protein [Acutalibacteraceae bacterium]|jgi:radical SAM superfamily enzyme YgiQ (UPF0313 family)